MAVGAWKMRWATAKIHGTPRRALLRHRNHATQSSHDSVIKRSSRGHMSVVSTSSSDAAAQRMLWLMRQTTEGRSGQQRVLAFTAERMTSTPSRLRRRLDETMPFHALERQGHGVFGVWQWCQQTLEETGREKRIFGRAKLTAFLLHHLHELPLLDRFKNLSSPLQARRVIMDLLQLFHLLESEGITSEMYLTNAKQTEDDRQVQLALAYQKYVELLATHHVTSWDGVVLEMLYHATDTDGKEFIDAALRDYTDIVIDDLHAMTPAMVKLLGQVCGHQSIQSSTSFSRVMLQEEECTRSRLLEKVLKEHVHVDSKSLELSAEVDNSAQRALRAIGQQILRASTSHKISPFSIDESSVLTCLAFETSTEEEEAIANLIRDKLSHMPAEEIAVLCPTVVDTQRIAHTLLNQGIPVQLHPLAGSIGNHLFDEPGVNVLFSLLVALCFPSDSKHLYNILRSDFFAFPGPLLSELMEKEHKSHISLFQVLDMFVATKGDSLKTQQLNEPVPGLRRKMLDEGLAIAQSFVTLISRLRTKCHQRSTLEIVQDFLEETGRLEALLEPASATQEQEAIALADFLRELEAAQAVVQSPHVPFVVPYLLQLRDTRVQVTQSSANADEESSSAVKVFPLTTHYVDSLEPTTLFLMSMRDSKFPGRMKRLTLPLPYKLLSRPFPIQTRQEYLDHCERLAFQALTCAKQEVILSYASLVTSAGAGTGATSISGKVKRESLSRVLVPIWQDQQPINQSNGSGTGEDVAVKAPESSTQQSFAIQHAYEPAHLSYSQIAEYIRCPHRYYLARIMKLPTEASTAMMYGRSLHAAIASFASSTQHMQQQKPETDEMKEESVRIVKEHAFRALESEWVSDGRLFLSPAHDQFLFDQAKTHLNTFIQDHLNADVLHVEHPFKVFVAEANVYLRGVWDRLDRTPDGGVVIREFKSNMSASERNATKLAAESLQLQIYMYAFEEVFRYAPYGAELELIGRSNGAEGGARQDKAFVPYTVSTKTKAIETIQKVATAMRKGEFHATPNYMECTFCPYASSVCRAGNEASAASM